MLKNNKGQVLVIFVILIPILFIILGMVIDLGYISLETKTISNNVKDTVLYYLNNMDDLNVKDNSYKMLEKNIPNTTDISIVDNPSSVEIAVIKNINNKYSITGKNHELIVVYKGYKVDKRIVKG